MAELGKVDREFFDIDPWAAISERTLLRTVDPDDVDGDPIGHPGFDPFWAAFGEGVERLKARGGTGEGEA